MTTVICDICKSECIDPVKVTFRDGEHPHNGSFMYKTADVCDDCIRLVPRLSCNEEIDEIILKYKMGKLSGK